MEEEPKHHHFPIFPLLWLGWAVVSAALLFFFAPTIKRSVEQSGVLAMYEQSQNEVVQEEYRTCEVSFLDSSGSYQIYRQKQRRLGGDIYHDTLESLLSGPDGENVRKGAFSAIDPQTRLIGCTLSCGTLFVDLSKEFNHSTNLQQAKQQVIETMTDFTTIDDVVILIEGKEAD